MLLHPIWDLFHSHLYFNILFKCESTFSSLYIFYSPSSLIDLIFYFLLLSPYFYIFSFTPSSPSLHSFQYRRWNSTSMRHTIRFSLVFFFFFFWYMESSHHGCINTGFTRHRPFTQVDAPSTSLAIDLSLGSMHHRLHWPSTFNSSHQTTITSLAKVALSILILEWRSKTLSWSDGCSRKLPLVLILLLKSM